jgi:hypothetical protein
MTGTRSHYLSHWLATPSPPAARATPRVGLSCGIANCLHTVVRPTLTEARVALQVHRLDRHPRHPLTALESP